MQELDAPPVPLDPSWPEWLQREWHRHFGDPEPTFEDYQELLRLDTLRDAGQLDEDGERRYRELAEMFSPPSTPEQVEELERKAASGEPMTLNESIERDAGLRRARPRNRPEARHWRERPVADWIFARSRTRPMGRRRRSDRRPGRRVPGRALARSPDPDPDPPRVADRLARLSAGRLACSRHAPALPPVYSSRARSGGAGSEGVLLHA